MTRDLALPRALEARLERMERRLEALADHLGVDVDDLVRDLNRPLYPATWHEWHAECRRQAKGVPDVAP